MRRHLGHWKKADSIERQLENVNTLTGSGVRIIHSFRLLKGQGITFICLVCFSGLFVLFPDTKVLSVLNYTDLNWDGSVVSIRAERSVTQTRLTPHHITLKGPYCGFCIFITKAFFTLLWSVGHSMGFLLDFFLSRFHVSMLWKLSETSCASKWRFSQLYGFVKLSLCRNAVMSKKHFKNSFVVCSGILLKDLRITGHKAFCIH